MNTEVSHMALLQGTGSTGTHASCRNTTAFGPRMLAMKKGIGHPFAQAGTYGHYTSLSIQSQEPPEIPILALDVHTPSRYRYTEWKGDMGAPTTPP